MNNFLQSFAQVFASMGLIFTSLFGHIHTLATGPSTQPTQITQQVGNVYHVSKSIAYQGHTITMSAAVPKDGGDITGTISGDCTGPITGKYDGNTAINGQSNVTCKFSFIQVPGTVTFSGTVDKTAKTAQLLVTVNVSSFQKSQNLTVSFN